MPDPTCTPCAEYVANRLPAVLRLWHAETGQKVRVVWFMRRVHDRHLAGLPILEATDGAR
jgi:hypothetical protein